MKKEGKVAVVILLVVLLIVAILACSYFVIKLDKKEKEMESIKNDLTKLKEDLNAKNLEYDKAEKNKEENIKKEENSINTDSLNEEYSKKILKIKGAGSGDGIYFAVMGKEGNDKDFEELGQNSKIINKNNYSYKLTNINYSEYEDNVSFMTESLFESLIPQKFVGKTPIINVDGKVAINTGSWTGTSLQYENQKLISKENNRCIYEIKYKQISISQMTEEKTAIVTGEIENGKYIIKKFEDK